MSGARVAPELLERHARLRLVLPELRERDRCASNHCHHFECKLRRQEERDAALRRARRERRRATVMALQQSVASLRDVMMLGEIEEVPWEELGGE